MNEAGLRDPSAVPVITTQPARLHESQHSDSSASTAQANLNRAVEAWPIAAPLLALLLASAIFRWTDLDLTLARWILEPNAREWPFSRAPLSYVLLHYGTYPSLVIAGWGWLMCWFPTLAPLPSLGRRAGLFILTVGLVANVGIINLTLKEHWGRPRPTQVEELGGDQPFQPLGSPGLIHQTNSSFPSGHAAAAYYLFVPAFVFGSDQRRGRRTWLAIGGTFGVVMSLYRMYQGGHFASDVLWSGAILYFTAVSCALLMLRRPIAVQSTNAAPATAPTT